MIVPEPRRFRLSIATSAFTVHTVGGCCGVGIGDGVGVGVGSGSVVGFGFVSVPGSGLVTSTGSGCVSGSGSTVTGGVVGPGVVSPGVVVVVVGVVVVVVGVPFAARSPTLRVTLGTSSSKTALLMVMSPEPVTSIETVSIPFFNLIET